MEPNTAVIEPNTEKTDSEVVNAAQQILNANGGTAQPEGDNGTAQGNAQGNGQGKNRWNETKHVFAQPHPAHELISCQTAYGRDLKDEEGNWIDRKPEGFDRIMLPNLVPSDRLAEAERLCRMHNVDLRDEWRFAMLQMTEAVITQLQQLPVPADYRETTRRLSDEERAQRKTQTEAQKAELAKLREEGKARREALKAERDAAIAEYRKRMEEITGKPYVPRTRKAKDGETAEGETETAGATVSANGATPVLSDVPQGDIPAPQPTTPVIEVTPQTETAQSAPEPTDAPKGGKAKK